MQKEHNEIEHIVLPGFVAKRELPIEGETIQGFLERTNWTFHIPTVCSLNNLPVMRRDWATTTISAPDKVSFISKPYGGGGSGGKMNNVFALVAVVALSVVAPWVGGALFAAGSFGYYATVAAITIGGGLLIQSFLAPKPAKSSDAANSDVPQMYSLTASGNTANPLQPIPVQYGRLKTEPPYASIPWGEFIGDDQYLNILLCQGMGQFDLEFILIDDTVLWEKGVGLNPSFTDVQIQLLGPGEPVTLFPSNVVAASEVDGQSLSTTYLGGFVANAAGTQANALAFDFILPGGLFSTSEEDAELHNATVVIWMEGRRIDDSGSPLSPFVTLLSPIITLNTRSPKRFSYKIDLPAGRWEARVLRTTPESTSTTVSDAVQWAQLRAFLVGSTSYPDVSLLAIRIKATAQLSQNAAKKFGVIQTKLLPIWDGSTFIDRPSKNPFWAFYDCATNQVYGAGLSPSRVDFQEIYAQALAADARGDSFNYIFDSAITFQEAFDIILGSARSKPAWVGDILSVTRDEWKPIPQMLLTDQQTVRGSVSVDYIINDETYADCVSGQFLNENTWGPAQLQYPPNSAEFTGTRPAVVQLPGITNPAQMMRELGFLYRQSQLRRINITLDTEHDGRLLRFGSAVRVQSNLPTKWGQSGEINSYNSLTKTLTVDRNLVWTTGQTHYLELRDKGGHYWGPVAVARGTEDNLLIVNAGDLASVEADLGPLADALDRLDGAEPPAFAFGIAGEFARNCVVLSGKPQDEKVTLSLAVDSEAVHDDSASPFPVLPTGPVLVDPRVPIVALLSANFRQGVIEPIIDATWWPAAGALYYRAAVSYDGGSSWLALPDISEPQLTAVVSRAALRLRVAAVGIMHGPWTSVDLEAPDITLSPGTVSMTSLKQGLKDYVQNVLWNAVSESKTTLQRIAAAAAEHDAARSVEDIAIRESLSAVSDRGKASVDFLTTTIATLEESFAQYQVVVTAQFDALEANVTTNATAIADANSAFSSYQLSVTAQFDSIVSEINLNATAIANVEGQVNAAVTLTLDVNGYVSGWESTNDGVSSTFGVIASNFYIAQPGVSGGSPVPVFAVNIIDGAAKLGFRGDMFVDGQLTSRMFSAASIKAIAIDSDQVETRHLTINSVGINELILNSATYMDVTAFAAPWAPGNPVAPPGPYTTITFFTKVVTIRSGRALITIQSGFFNQIAGYGSGPSSQVSLYVDAILHRQWSYTYSFTGASTWQLTDPITVGWVVEGLTDGTHTITLTLTNGPGMADGQVYVVDLRR